MFARISVGHDMQQSSVQYKTVKPRWDEKFQFLVDDPESRPVTVEVRALQLSALCTQSYKISSAVTNGIGSISVAKNVLCHV